jgi:hypothetical protein
MPRKKPHIHYIYKTTCNVTKMYYIGMHSTSNLEDGYMGSGKRLRYSIRKYGNENHTKEILEYLPSREELIIRETKIVDKVLLSDNLCLNLKEGGQGGFISEEHHKKMCEGSSKWITEKWENKEFRDKMVVILYETAKKTFQDGRNKSSGWWLGKNHSEKTKKLLSKLKKNTGIGDKNSQFGTCWITKGDENKKIKKKDLNIYLQEDWVKGRKLK